MAETEEEDKKEDKDEAPRRLDNLLAKWLIPSPISGDGGGGGGGGETKKKKKLRAFSHAAGSPAEVPRWVLVELEGLGDPVLFDARSCEAMHERDVSFVVSPNREPVAVLHAVYLKGGAKGS
jgi:hypothetical protein